MEDKKYSICVDFDGVLHQYVSPWTGRHEVRDPPIPGAIPWLEEMTEKFKVYIWSTRCNSTDGIMAIDMWLRANGLSEAAADRLVYWQGVGKPTALIYIDDRGFRFDGIYPSANEIHMMFPYKFNGDVANNYAEIEAGIFKQ